MRKMLREGAAFKIRRSELEAGTRKWVLGARHQLHPCPSQCRRADLSDPVLAAHSSSTR